MTLTRDLRGFPFEERSVLGEAGDYALRTYGVSSGLDLFAAATLGVRAEGCDRAVAAMGETDFYGSIYDLSLAPQLLASQCFAQEGRVEDSLHQAQRALVIRPGSLDGLAMATVGAELVGDKGAARWREELFALHDPFSAHAALARAYRFDGQSRRALDEAQAVLTQFPKMGWVEYERALDLLALGDEEGALDSLALALEDFPSHTFEVQPFSEALTHSLARSRTPTRVSLAAELALRRGQLREARALDAESDSSSSMTPRSPLAMSRRQLLAGIPERTRVRPGR